MYRFYKGKNTITCVSSYAGKTVRGVAKCAPNDEWDEDLGKRLAKLRCDVKVAKKRAMNAAARRADAEEAMVALTKYAMKMMNYHEDSLKEYKRLTDELTEFERKV